MPRIALLSQFNIRPSKNYECKKKTLFAFEGTETEVRYFRGICKNKKTLTKFYFFYKQANNDSSNLANVTSKILDMIDGTSPLQITYSCLKSMIYDSFLDSSVLVEKEKIESILSKFANRKGKTLSDGLEESEIDDIFRLLNDSFLNYGVGNITNFEEIKQIITSDTVYDPSIDQIVIIGDRDCGSFTETQYDFVLQTTVENQIRLFISNPCIEFWFLLHFTDAKEIDKSQWFTQQASQYVYNELKKYDAHYGKCSLKVEEYVSKVKTAIQNASCYEKNIELLKTNIGTNIPDLILFLDEL